MYYITLTIIRYQNLNIFLFSDIVISEFSLKGALMEYPEIATLVGVYFDAMAKGWASTEVNEPKTLLVPDMPGFVEIRYADPNSDLVVVNQYGGKRSSDVVSGTTTIWRDGELLWIMQYLGKYPPEVLPFLKSCLLKAWVTEQKFYGGRGPYVMANNEYLYHNDYRDEGIMNNYGLEEILSGRERIGWHRYQCHLLD
jgi:hypothetical protein